MNGLMVGSSVLYNGIEVGIVTETGFAEDSVEQIVATLLLEKDVTIKTNTRARLYPVGITGNMQVELYGATDEADALSPGSRIPATSSTLDLITEPVANVANQLLILLNRISSVFDERGQANINDSLDNVAGILRENREPIENIIANLDSFTTTMDTFVSEQRDPVGATVVDLNETVRRLSNSAAAIERTLIASPGEAGGTNLPELMVQVAETLDRANQSIFNIENMVLNAEGDLQSNLHLLRETLEYLNIFAAKISENPSQLIR